MSLSEQRSGTRRKKISSKDLSRKENSSGTGTQHIAKIFAQNIGPVGIKKLSVVTGILWLLNSVSQSLKTVPEQGVLSKVRELTLSYVNISCFAAPFSPPYECTPNERLPHTQ